MFDEMTVSPSHFQKLRQYLGGLNNLGKHNNVVCSWHFWTLRQTRQVTNDIFGDKHHNATNVISDKRHNETNIIYQQTSSGDKCNNRQTS